MPYRGSNATTVCLESPGDIAGRVADAEGRRGMYAVIRPLDEEEVARLERQVMEEEERNRDEFRKMRAEARSEFKTARNQILKQYEERLVAAKEQYLEDAVVSRERLLASRQEAREEYENSLKNAKNNYDFILDIVKDQFQIAQRETTRVIKLNAAVDERALTRVQERSLVPQRPSARVIQSLDEEIRSVTAKIER